MADFGPRELLACYARGVFPMSDSRDDDELFLVDPKMRGILPLDAFHISKSLKKTMADEPFDVRIDTAFGEVIRGCSAPRKHHPDTWISDKIIDLYSQLFRAGYAHSIECWRDGTLVGGLYGVALGGAFFGESMFSVLPNASKVALVGLVARLQRGGFVLLDTQFVTDHLRSFGAIEIPRATFQRRLQPALMVDANFHALPTGLSCSQLLQSITHTS